MKKLVLFLMMGCFININAITLIKAKDARTMTDLQEKKIEKRLMRSEKGKKIYEDLINFFNRNISEISSKGYYNVFQINVVNKPGNEIEKILKPLSSIEKEAMSAIIKRQLLTLGYRVTLSQFGLLYIKVSW